MTAILEGDVTLSIRKAIKDDLAQLCELFDGYRIYYKQTSDLAKAEAFLSERLEKNDSTIFVAEENGTLLGFTQIYPIFSSVNARRTLLLNDLYVSEAARRKGVARALMNKATEFAKSEGAHWMMLQTEKANEKAQALYESLGYKRDDECYYYYLTT